MPQPRDWREMRDMMARLLVERTGENVEPWVQRVEQEGIDDKHALRAWLESQGVTGYAQSLLVMERFGYPDFFMATGGELIDAQYQDRPRLRPIYDAVVTAAATLGDVAVQARKTYVSLLTPRRTFARVKPSTRTRVDLALRLEGHEPGGRLEPSKIQETMRVQVGLTSPAEVDAEVIEWLSTAYRQNS